MLRPAKPQGTSEATLTVPAQAVQPEETRVIMWTQKGLETVLMSHFLNTDIKVETFSDHRLESEGDKFGISPYVLLIGIPRKFHTTNTVWLEEHCVVTTAALCGYKHSCRAVAYRALCGCWLQFFVRLQYTLNYDGQ